MAGWELNIDFEAAIDVLNMAVGCYSGKIGDEEKKEHPNQTLIDHWDKEQSSCIAERRNLSTKDPGNLVRVQKVYGAKVRAMFAELENEQRDEK